MNRTNSIENGSISIRSHSSSIETSESKISSINSGQNLINLPAKDMLSLYEQFSQAGIAINGSVNGPINGQMVSHYGTLNSIYGTGKSRKNRKSRHQSGHSGKQSVVSMPNQYS